MTDAVQRTNQSKISSASQAIARSFRKPRRGTISPAGIRIGLLSFLMAIFLIVGCTTIPPCGDFTFTGTEFDTTDSNGVDASVYFAFDPGDCECECECDLIPYVQIVRTWSFDDAMPLYPSTEKEDRATANGYYIDRIAGRKWGYYGRNDDGTFALYLTPGSNTTDAVLLDSPRRPESSPWLNIWWQAVSAPVCIDAEASCQNHLLGYYFWSWVVNSDGTVTGIIDLNAWESLDNEFSAAVGEWNGQAPGLGKNRFSRFARMTDGSCTAPSGPTGRFCRDNQKCCEPALDGSCFLCWPKDNPCP